MPPSSISLANRSTAATPASVVGSVVASLQSIALPALTRRRYPERHDCWHVYYGDVHVGTIAPRTGVPHDEDPWGWSCGFASRGMHQRIGRNFRPGARRLRSRMARVSVEADESRFSGVARRAGLDRAQICHVAAGERLPSQKPSSLMTCPCGEVFDSHRLEHTLIHVPYISAVARGTNRPAMA
jgi:hypothetical protein